MKKIKVLALAVVALLSGFAASAQSINDNYSRVYAGYNNFSFEDEDFSMNGFLVGYEYNWNIAAHHYPVFLGVGLEYLYATDTEDGTELTFHSLGMPVLVSYKFTYGDCSMAPFIGQSARIGLAFDAENGGKSISYYDEIKGEGGTDVGDFSRFQLLFNVGANFWYKNFCLGYRFQVSEFSMMPEVSYQGHVVQKELADFSHCISIGYCF